MAKDPAKDPAVKDPKPDGLRHLLSVPQGDRVQARLSAESSGGAVDPIQHRDPSLHYYILDVKGLTPQDLYSARYGLADQGYSPLTGPYYEGAPRAEVVIGRPHAELWAMPAAEYRTLEIQRRRQVLQHPVFQTAHQARSTQRPPVPDPES